jgi:hypothetical protein
MTLLLLLAGYVLVTLIIATVVRVFEHDRDTRLFGYVGSAIWPLIFVAAIAIVVLQTTNNYIERRRVKEES